MKYVTFRQPNAEAVGSIVFPEELSHAGVCCLLESENMLPITAGFFYIDNNRITVDASQKSTSTDYPVRVTEDESALRQTFLGQSLLDIGNLSMLRRLNLTSH